MPPIFFKKNYSYVHNFLKNLVNIKEIFMIK